MIEDPDSNTVDLPALERGLVLLDWFKHETRRIYGQLAESVEFRDCKTLLDAIHRRGGTAKARDLYRSGVLNSDKERVERTLDMLAGRGLGEWVEIAPGPEGGRRTREFHLSEVYTRCKTRETAKPSKNPSNPLPDETAKPTKPEEERGSVSNAGFAEGIEVGNGAGGFGSNASFAEGGEYESPETPLEGTL
jgi:hypothetical protein